MSNRNIGRFGLAMLLLVALVFVCGAAAVTGFLVGRTTAEPSKSADGNVAVATSGEMPQEQDESQPSVAVDAADENESASPDTPAPASQPEATATPDAPATVPPDFSPSLERDTSFSEEDLELFWETWEIIEREFDGELPDDEDATYSAIRGVLETLDDDFTRFAPPDAAARMREDLQGAFEGIGAFVRENDEGLTEIVRPMDGQPADEAGLMAGDVVIAVDGESMVDTSLEEVIALIRGPRGTDVTLTIRRPEVDDPFDVTVTRQRIEIPVITSEMLDENIGYVWLTSFNRNARPQLEEAVTDLLEQEPSGLILDLRDNPGGFLDQSVAVSDLFLPEGVVLYERSMTMGIDQTFNSDDGDIAEEIPLVVLVNAGSASASEIVAGAIQDNGRGVLIGETTFGKGSVQQTHTLSDGSELRVTVARWYLPSNRSIDEEGVMPDIFVETPEDLGGESDAQLEAAIDYLLGRQ